MEFGDKVRAIVGSIPEGKVLSYGDIAKLIGHPRAARQVGMALRRGLDGDIPWHRVVNARGGISTFKVGSGELQLALLQAEGVVFNHENECNLAHFRWQGPDVAIIPTASASQTLGEP